MKRCSKLAGIVVLISILISAPAISDTGVRVSVGLSHIGYGDFNDMVGPMNSDSLLNTFNVKMANMNWIPEIQAEVFHSPLPLLTVGLGAGYMYGCAGLSDDLFGKLEHTVKVYPITVTGYFKPSLPLMPVKPYVYGGLGIYYSKLSFSYTGLWQQYSQQTSSELTKSGFGLHGGAGLEFSILPMISFQVGVQGRWAKIEGFEGTGTDLNGNSIDVFLVSDSEFEYQVNSQTYVAPGYGACDIADRDKYDEGALDLTGYGFTIGLKFSF